MFITEAIFKKFCEELTISSTRKEEDVISEPCMNGEKACMGRSQGIIGEHITMHAYIYNT